MHFLLYLPNAVPNRPDDDVLKGIHGRCKFAGLTDLLTEQEVLPNSAGPECEIGTMIGWPAVGDRMHYQPERQEWIKSILKLEDGTPAYWVGFDKEKPCTESQLRRKYTQDGTWVEFGKQKWKLPTPDTVDSRAFLQDDGSYKWEPVREFSWMCDEAQQLRDAYMQEFGLRSMVFQVDPSAQINWLLKLLRVNYRLTPEVANHLGLWFRKDAVLTAFLGSLGLKVKESANG